MIPITLIKVVSSLPRRLMVSSSLALCATIFFVFNDAIIKYVATKNVEYYHFVFYGTPAYLVVPLYLLISGKASKRLSATNYLIPLIRGVIFVPMPLITFWALENVSLPEFTILTMTAPIFSLLFAVFIIKEKINLFLISSLCFGIVGVALVVKPGFDVFNPFFFLILLNAFLIAITTFIVNRFKNVTSSEGYFFYGGLFVHIFCFILFVNDPRFFNLYTSILMVIASLFVNAAIFFVVIAFRKAQDFYGSLSCLNYMQILWSMLIGLLVFEQVLDLVAVVGAVFIALSGVLSFPAQAKQIGQRECNN